MKPVALLFLAFLAFLAALLAPTSAFAQTERATGDTEESSPAAQSEPGRNPGEIQMYGVLDVGYAYESVAGVPISAAAFTAMAGIDLRSWGLELEFDVAPGRTDGGLSTLAVTGGIIGEAHLGRLRLGGGPRVGSLNISRVTTSGSLEWATFGVLARVSYDVLLLDSNDRALFVVAKGGIDATSDSALAGLSGGVGVRF